MKTSIEISYYPLTESYLKPIGQFIERLHQHNAITIRTSGMSTQIFGDYDDVMSAVTMEIKRSFELPHSVFVMKVINADLQEIPS